MNNSSFWKWLFTFLTLLFSITVLLKFKQQSLSIGLGIVLVFFVMLALVFWTKKLKEVKGKHDRVKLTINDRMWLENHIPFYKLLSKADKLIFEDRIGLFLSNVIVTEIDKEIPEKSTSFYVASSAVMAFWGLPYYNYANLREVLIYPSNFNQDNSLSTVGLVQGKVYHGGLMNNTMILSLPALIAGFSIKNDKKNVGVHEFAHLLDKNDGKIDGIPDGMTESDRNVWSKLVEEEMDKINRGKSTIPDYGGTHKTEFFAVLVEYYKECPDLLKVKHPQLYEILERYFSKE